MARVGDGSDLLKCSFCGKSQKQVKKLIAGPGVYICDECIDLCNEIIEEERGESANLGWDEVRLPNPVFAGDTIHVECEVTEARLSQSKPGRGLVRTRNRVVKQDGTAKPAGDAVSPSSTSKTKHARRVFGALYSRCRGGRCS